MLMGMQNFFAVRVRVIMPVSGFRRMEPLTILVRMYVRVHVGMNVGMPMGTIVEPVLRLCNVLTYRVDRAEEAGETVQAAADLAFGGDLAVAVLLSQRLIGRKQWVHG